MTFTSQYLAFFFGGKGTSSASSTSSASYSESFSISSTSYSESFSISSTSSSISWFVAGGVVTLVGGVGGVVTCVGDVGGGVNCGRRVGSVVNYVGGVVASGGAWGEANERRRFLLATSRSPGRTNLD
ncbi:hypothetical protein P8452_25620 [Trifolium repens]|nr:hypothetical protein P8452_25620 [Trifolium repens]